MDEGVVKPGGETGLTYEGVRRARRHEKVVGGALMLLTCHYLLRSLSTTLCEHGTENEITNLNIVSVWTGVLARTQRGLKSKRTALLSS